MLALLLILFGEAVSRARCPIMLSEWAGVATLMCPRGAWPRLALQGAGMGRAEVPRLQESTGKRQPLREPSSSDRMASRAVSGSASKRSLGLTLSPQNPTWSSAGSVHKEVVTAQKNESVSHPGMQVAQELLTYRAH